MNSCIQFSIRPHDFGVKKTEGGDHDNNDVNNNVSTKAGTTGNPSRN